MMQAVTASQRHVDIVKPLPVQPKDLEPAPRSIIFPIQKRGHAYRPGTTAQKAIISKEIVEKFNWSRVKRFV